MTENQPEIPEPPDMERVRELRGRLRSDKAEANIAGNGPKSRFAGKSGKAARDLGTYTLIPSLMIAGPVVGYVLGRLVEKNFGGEPWGAVGGMLLGLVAGFRQVFILVAKKGTK